MGKRAEENKITTKHEKHKVKTTYILYKPPKMQRKEQKMSKKYIWGKPFSFTLEFHT